MKPSKVNTWKIMERPPRLERRFEFSGYTQLREFLDRVAELSESVGLYPDIGFGRSYVSITIYANDGATNVDTEQYEFAYRIDELANLVTSG